LKRLITISGPANSGKTTLIENLIRHFTAEGLRVGVVKHDPHGHVRVDSPGKDSWRMREAGATVVQILGPRPVTLSYGSAPPPDSTVCDIVLAEGAKTGARARLEVVSPGATPLLAEGTLGLVTDELQETSLPAFARDNVDGIARFIKGYLAAQATPVVILAGGASWRMGQDKATMRLPGGETMLARATAIARSHGDRVLVVSRHEELHRGPSESAGCFFTLDEMEEQHPATGIASGLRFFPGEALLAISCDSPQLNPAILAVLERRAEAKMADFALFAVGGRLQPLPGYFAPGCLAPLREIACGGAPLHRLSAEVETLILSEQEAIALDPHLRSFRSLNTPGELAEA
jgi:molybdopterin-guanine dinucleotide biosynthesis protein MobB